MESSNDHLEPNVAKHSKRQHCSLTRRDWVKLVSNLAIPLIIGVFTIIISIHQQNVAQANRDKDTAQAAELRKNDLDIARLQREEDKAVAAAQREEDKRAAQRQREEDNELAQRQREEDREAAEQQRDDDREIARRQREVDSDAAKDKRTQEAELAAKQRDLYRHQRDHDFKVARQNRMDDLTLKDNLQHGEHLIAYQRELSTLLTDSRMDSIKANSTFLFVLQKKTVTYLSLLDPTRRTILIQSLFRTQLMGSVWKKGMSLLDHANVSGVQFGQPPDGSSYDFLVKYDFPDIKQADVRSASFRALHFLNQPSFASSNLDFTDWSFSELDNFDFESQMTMNYAVFANSRLTRVGFTKIPMDGVSFQFNKNCSRCFFLESSLLSARLDHATFFQSTFASLSMARGNMSHGCFLGSLFEGVILDAVDLSASDLRQCTFQNVSMVHCFLFDVQLEGVAFINVNLSGCTGLDVHQISLTRLMKQVILPNGTLLS